MSLQSWFLRTTYWTRDFFKGSPIRSHYRDISSILGNFHSGEKKREIYLKKILKYAVENTEYYRLCNFNDFSSFPVVNKTVLLDNFDKIKIDESKIPGQVGKVFVQTTSGSTGTPFAIPQDTIKRNRRIAELKYFGQKSGFKSHDKLVHLRTWNRWQTKTKKQSVKENIIPFNIAQINDNRLKELTQIIKDNNVKAVRGYASSIDLLARYASDNSIKLPCLKLMIAGSEALQDSTRELVKQNLNCNIISQYANEENGILAQESVFDKEGGIFHLNYASYFFEILKLNEDLPADYGEIGRIVLTDLFNYAFPVIRYDTGDTAVLTEGNRTTKGYPVITKLYGRRLDLVFDTQGEIVFPMALARILKHYSEIIQWQFIQNDKNEYLLKLITKDSFSKGEEVLMQLKELFGADADIKVEFTDDIPVLGSGKRKPVVNNWKI